MSAARAGRTTPIPLLLRTGHAVSVAIVAGGAWFGVDPGAYRRWLGAAGATGLALVVVEVRHGRGWALEGRGLLALAHVAVLALALRPGGAAAATLAAFVLGMVGSHMSRGWRKWSLLRGRAAEDPEPPREPL